VSLFLVLVLVVAAVIFAVQNATTVTITVFFWHLQASLAIVVAVCVLMGALGGLLVLTPRLYRMRADRRHLRALLANLAAEDVPDESPAPQSSDLKLRSPQTP
jgi:lipopolysaccharide assembly protein A